MIDKTYWILKRKWLLQKWQFKNIESFPRLECGFDWNDRLWDLKFWIKIKWNYFKAYISPINGKNKDLFGFLLGVSYFKWIIQIILVLQEKIRASTKNIYKIWLNLIDHKI